MTKKSANVTARVEPQIKQQAEAILDKLGIPVPVLINALYRQIIMTSGVPFPLTIPGFSARADLTDRQFNEMMERGYNQAKYGDGLSIDEAFSAVDEDI